MSPREYSVYILTNVTHTVLYTGVTNNLPRRILEHQQQRGSAFTRKYHATQLVYYETTDDVSQAIQREKQIKAGSRKKKLELIEQFNPEWKDLADELL